MVKFCNLMFDVLIPVCLLAAILSGWYKDIEIDRLGKKVEILKLEKKEKCAKPKAELRHLFKNTPIV